MFAVYATRADPDDPLSALKIGERPEPDVPEGWLRVKISHASLNRHDLLTTGGTTGFEVALNLLPMITEQLTIIGSIMGTLDDMQEMMNLIVHAGIEPEIGVVLPMERAAEAFQAMWEGKTHGKTVFTR